MICDHSDHVEFAEQRHVGRFAAAQKDELEVLRFEGKLVPLELVAVHFCVYQQLEQQVLFLKQPLRQHQLQNALSPQRRQCGAGCPLRRRGGPVLEGSRRTQQLLPGRGHSTTARQTAPPPRTPRAAPNCEQPGAGVHGIWEQVLQADFQVVHPDGRAHCVQHEGDIVAHAVQQRAAHAARVAHVPHAQQRRPAVLEEHGRAARAVPHQRKPHLARDGVRPGPAEDRVAQQPEGENGQVLQFQVVMILLGVGVDLLLQLLVLELQLLHAMHRVLELALQQLQLRRHLADVQLRVVG
mmetsp:Transcript_11090/g.27098  ORF Transcript_11090/g.27098 Transcript_11090/m.27098 type:complete len:296 (+) Transcript_11090:134-1021(+)